MGVERRHYQEAGIKEQLVRQRLSKIYSERAFISREPVEGFARDLWFKRIPTPLKKADEYVQNFVAA